MVTMLKWYITAEFVSAIMLCIIIIYARKGNQLPTLKNTMFQYCLQLTLISITANIVSTILLEFYDQVPFAINMALLILYYCTTPLMGVVYFIYTLSNIYEEKQVYRYALICSFPASFYLGLILLNPFNHLLFSFNVVHGYVQGPWIIMTYVVFYIYVLFSVVLVLHKRATLERNVFYILGVFPFISALVILFQFIYPKYIMTGTAATTALLIIYLYLQNKQMFTDSLTGLLNRQEFNRMIDIALKSNQNFTVLVLSLKSFKFINDKFGQEVGDEILLQVCDYLRSLLPRNALYRYGGDEFALIGYETDQLKQAVQAIHIRMNHPWKIANMEFMIHYVIGGIVIPEVAAAKEEIINGLEFTVMSAKKEKAEQIYFCTTDMMQRIRRKYQIVDLLQDCITHHCFEVYYQPIYDDKTNTFQKAEALLRLPSNHLGFVSPEEFIPIAEENGLITAITYQVLDQTCQFLKQLKQKRSTFENISVNFSVVSFMQEDLVEGVEAILRAHELPMDQISIEITESMLMSNYDAILKFMHEMRERGVQFLLDDFGTGYSNMSRVLSIPFQVIKIDKSLVWKAMQNEQSAVIVKKMVEAFAQVGLHVLAEGIETKEQADFMIACGCEYLQGYYYAKPLQAQAALELMTELQVP